MKQLMLDHAFPACQRSLFSIGENNRIWEIAMELARLQNA